MDPSAYDRMAALQADHWWFAARRRIIRDQVRRMDLPENAVILDAGCGPGANLAMLSEFGDVTGMEMDGGARAYAQKTGLKVLDGHLPDGAPFAPESFDLIGAFDVIEHIEDDQGAVAGIQTLLKPGSAFLATVPANPWMWSTHDTHHHHFRRYTKASLTKLIEGAGFEIERMTYFNTFLYPVAAAVRLTRNTFSASDRDASDDRMPSAPVNTVLKTIFSAELPVLSVIDLPFGVSLMVKARRGA